MGAVIRRPIVRWIGALVVATLALASTVDLSAQVRSITTRISAFAVLAGDGTASAPSYSFASDPDNGMYLTAANAIGFAVGGSGRMLLGISPDLRLGSGVSLGWSSSADPVGSGADVSLSRGAADRLDLATGDSFKLVSGGLGVGVTNTTAGTIQASAPQITVGSGTGITVNNAGEFRDVIYKVTVDRTQFVAAAVTADATIATFPAKTQVIGVMADLTQTFACTATCTSSTLSFMLGRGSGGAQFLASFDADAATAQFGDADAELGTTMTRAAAIQGGSFEAWGSTQAVVLRLTSGTGNIGNGAATNLSQGSVTIYLVTRVFP